MIYGGIISRLVSPKHLGAPELEGEGLFHIEYVKEDRGDVTTEAGDVPDLTWTTKRDEAFHYPRHLDAMLRAETIGHCRVCVATDEAQRAENARIQERILGGRMDDEGSRIDARSKILRAVSASSTGAVKQAELVETSVRDNELESHHGDAPRPQNSFNDERSLPEPVRDRRAHFASAPGSGDRPKRKRLSKRARMLALRESARRVAATATSSEGEDGSDRTTRTDKVPWWKEGQFA